PVGNEEVAAIAAWEKRVAVAGDAGWRAAAGGANRRHDIGEVRRLSPRLRQLRRPPAVIAAGHDVIEPARFIPRQADAALVVRIESERFAFGIEIEAVG